MKYFVNTRQMNPRTTTTALYVSLNKPPLELCDENIDIVMDEIRKELGTLFGYDAGRLNFTIVLYFIHHTNYRNFPYRI